MTTGKCCVQVAVFCVALFFFFQGGYISFYVAIYFQTTTMTHSLSWPTSQFWAPLATVCPRFSSNSSEMWRNMKNFRFLCLEIFNGTQVPCCSIAMVTSPSKRVRISCVITVTLRAWNKKGSFVEWGQNGVRLRIHVYYNKIFWFSKSLLTRRKAPEQVWIECHIKCFSIKGRKMKTKVTTTANQRNGKYH